MTDGQVCCGCVVVHPDGDVALSVAAADWRCWRRGCSCQQGSAASCCLDTDGLSGRAWTWHDLTHRASASRRVEAVTVHGHICVCRWRGALQHSWLFAIIVRHRPRCTSEYRVANVYPGRDKSVDHCLYGFVAQRPSHTSKLVKPKEGLCTDRGDMFVQAKVKREGHAEYMNMVNGSVLFDRWRQCVPSGSGSGSGSFYQQILSTENSFHIYESPLTVINVIASFCALNLRIKFWYLLF